MNERTITRVSIKNLFGLYSYDLPGERVFSNAAILYGDNGVGKSTLLWLIYHLLSPAPNRSHRTKISKVEFDRLEVELSTGYIFTAAPLEDEGLQMMRLEIVHHANILARWDCIPGKHRRRDLETEQLQLIYDDEGTAKRVRRRSRLEAKKDGDIPVGERTYLKLLEHNAPKMFILNADRRLDSDTVADPSDEIELRRLMHFDNVSSINQLVQRSREIGLAQALSSAARWISRKAILGTNQGSTNVHSVYVDVVKRLASPIFGPIESADDKRSNSDLMSKLEDISHRMNEHARYQLATSLSIEEFRKALDSQNQQKADLAAELLLPYVKSLESRLEAVEPIYEIIDDFVTIINEFLNDKVIDFKLGGGFQITNRFDRELEASQLSSGEQQLLLLFCYVITARDEPSVFMIDEPEISLNIKWQRQLIQALLEITKNSEIQFIFASHSMELLAQHRNRVLKLESSFDG